MRFGLGFTVSASKRNKSTIGGSNSPPTISVGGDQSVAAGVTVTMTASASDPDGSISTYSWTKISGTATPTLSGESSSVCTFTSPSSGSSDVLIYRCTVTDNQGATAFDEIQISVAASGGGYTDNPGPAGSASFTVTFDLPLFAADGGTLGTLTYQLVEYGTINNGAKPYKKYVTQSAAISGQALGSAQIIVSSIASGTYYATVTSIESTGVLSNPSAQVEKEAV